jgi:leucyl-tRNA synthetase
MEYHFTEVEKHWQQYWAEQKTFRADNESPKPKYYVLDMFPYPSGAGLHVGHPLGYIASDIFSRYKRNRGFNVLHPMGYDSFGLPAEQYAIQTGQHPAITTEENIARYRRQLDRIGFSFDWDREVRTSSPEYYRWTQHIFGRLFNAWYDHRSDRARNIEELIAHFEQNGTENLQAACGEEMAFTARDWAAFSEKRKSEVMLNYRLAYRSESMVNWCPALGTVLANDEVKDGVSERGGHPVVQKKMMQWSMRITAYAQRLLDGLDTIDWSVSIKESQRNWIGRSEGASIRFAIQNQEAEIEVFTTRPDTLWGVSFMTLAPEHELVSKITTPEFSEAVKAYQEMAAKRSERDRMADVKHVSGQFTGAFALHPFSGEAIPIWIGDYVLAGYGTGAVMAVPGHDSRDWAFAKHFGLPIKEVVAGGNVELEAFESKEGNIVNSDFITGMSVKAAIKKVIEKLEEKGVGMGKVNFRLRDAIFGRQRYWGEPIPIYYVDDIPHLIPDQDLPLTLPEVDKYLPTEDGEPPLARAKDFTYKGHPLETTTMPGWAGSSWYYLRYMDPANKELPVSQKAEGYWQNVDLYIGGSEHATGHLLYARFWHKFLKDMGLVSTEEPFKKLINQGMILGTSALTYRIDGTNTFVSHGLKEQYNTVALHADVNMVENDVLDVEAFKNWRPDLANAEFILENGKYICGSEVDKMSKRWYNVVNPDDICNKYGADTLRLYEMFLGPLEQAKPWNTNGITGVFNFLKKLWRLAHNRDGNFVLSDEKATNDELKTLHKTIGKITSDIEQFSFNTCVSAFMICVNELQDLKCNKREIIEPLVVLLSPFAPHISEELWKKMGHNQSISTAAWPEFKPEYLVESSFDYPVMFNGKLRFKVTFELSASAQEIEAAVRSHPQTEKYLGGQPLKKVIVVPKKIVNVVF